MASRKISIPTSGPRSAAGFTLVEVLVCLAIFTVLMSLGVFMTMDAYRGYAFRSERDTIAGILEKARSRAMNNVYESPHGACYSASTGSYVLFRGAAYRADAPSNETIDAAPTVIVSSTPSTFYCWAGGVAFSQLSGTTTAVDIAITQEARTSTIRVNEEGGIIW